VAVNAPERRSRAARAARELVRLLLVALAVVVGVSLFLGLLVSLSSSSATSNLIAGTILTYTRGFRLGDRVRIADATGNVIDKSLFVTRVRTPKNVVVSIPNSLVIGSPIVNYSRGADTVPRFGRGPSCLLPCAGGGR